MGLGCLYLRPVSIEFDAICTFASLASTSFDYASSFNAYHKFSLVGNRRKSAIEMEE